MRALLSMVLLATSPAMSNPPKYHERAPLNGQKLPFSESVQVGDLLILSGQIGSRPDGTLPDGIEAQARQTMDNIGEALKHAGLEFGDVVKCTVMLDDMSEWGAFNKVYVTYFTDPAKLPARSAFGADGLALGAKVEVECWAYAGAR